MITTEELRQISLFSELNDDALKAIAAFSAIREYADGEVILSENAGSDQVIRDLYLLMDGTVNVTKKVSGFKLFKKNVNIQAIDSEVYGEIGWLLGSKPSAEISSNGGCRMLVVDGGELFDLCEQKPKAGVTILYGLAAVLSMRLVNLTATIRK